LAANTQAYSHVAAHASRACPVAYDTEAAPVTSYTITITPDDGQATTTALRLDISGGDVRLTDLHLQNGNGLSGGTIPAIDYGLLLQAITPTSPTPVVSAPEIEAAPAPVSPATRRSSPRRGRSKAAAEPVTKPRTRRGGRAAAASAAPAATTGRVKKAAKQAARSASENQRPYRRMPDDFAAVFRQAGGGATAIADHYKVPRHTANGWIRRHRGQGGG
jgi:hypothetical protein